MTEPTSADPDALSRFVDASARARGELSERTAELDGLVRWVESGCVDFGVPGMAALVERTAALAVQWELSETGVAAMSDALVAADVGPGPLPVVFDVVSLADQGRNGVADELAGDLVRAGTTEPLAAVIAAETVRLVAADPSVTVYEALRRASATATGVSEDELNRRGRAFGQSRASVAAVVLEHWDQAERASDGYGHGVTLAGMRAVADDERAPTELRDAAYRLASDPGLFNDLDAAARTKGVAVNGYDWSETDGVIGRSDLEGFGERDGRMRTVLPWRLLLDTAADGFRLDGADGVVQGRDLERFVHDRRIPMVVRRVAWDLYAESDPDLVRDLRPFEAADEEGDEGADDGPGDAVRRGWGAAPLGGSRWLATGRRRPGGMGGGAPEAARGAGGTGAAGLGGLVAAVVATALEPVVDAGVDRAVAAWDRARSPGMPSSFVVFDPLTARPVSLDSAGLRGRSGDDAVAAVFWAAATARPPAPGQPAEPIPDDAWIDEHGLWRDGRTDRPLVGTPPWTAAAGSQPLLSTERPTPTPKNPYQYEDLNGDLRWVDTNELVSQRPNRAQYRDAQGAWRWDDTGALVGFAPSVRGGSSGRSFDPMRAGGEILQLDYRSVEISAQGVEQLKIHLDRFDLTVANELMVDRLDRILDGALTPTDFDRRFYSHELRELERYRALGIPDGVDPGYDVWNDVHTAALEDYGLSELDREGRSTLYHPDVPVEGR